MGRRHARRRRGAVHHENPALYVPPRPAAGELTAAFAKAAGVAAVSETLNGVRERSAAGYIGWPPALLVARLRGQQPAHKLVAGDPAQSGQAQRSDVDNAINKFAAEVGSSLPEPWSRTVRAQARSEPATPRRRWAGPWPGDCPRETRSPAGGGWSRWPSGC